MRLVFAALIGACPLILSAQEIKIGSENDKPIEEKLVYHHQNTFNIALHSQGLGAGFKIGKIKSIYKTTNWETEFLSIHSPKEIRIVNSTEYNARPFVYGKLNSVFAVRFGYGAERQLFGKPYWGGAETRWNYEAGVSLAVLKPYYYYVTVYQANEDGSYEEIITEQTFDQSGQWSNILGRSSFFKGIGESSFSPGLHVKTGLSFDFSASRSSIKALNVGMVAEAYPMGVSIMDGQTNKWLYLTFYVSYNWGSRFNKY